MAEPKTFTLPPPVEISTLRTEMGGLPVVPDFATKARRIKSSQQAQEAGAEALKRSTELQQEIGLAKQAQELTSAKAQQAIASQERERAYAIEGELEKKEKELQPQFKPTKDTVDTMAALFSVVGVLGMAMGGLGKQSSVRALNSMSGMLKGYRQGRADLVKQEEKEFDKQMQIMKFELDKAVRGAERAMRLLATDRREAEATAAVTNAQLGSSIGKQILENQGVEAWSKYVMQSILPTRLKAEELASQERRHRETLASQERLRQAQLGLNQLLKIDPAIRNKLEEYPDYDINKLIGIPTKSQTQVVESFESLNSIEDIGKFVRSNPDAVGLLAELANRTNINTLDSMQTWEAQVNSNPNLPESAKMLNKMLTSQAYRDVSATGQRPTVYLDKVFKDLYSQNSSPSTLLSILKQREKEANNILTRYDLSIDKNVNANRFELYKTEPREYMKSARFVTSDGKEVTALQVEDTAKKRKKNFATVVRELGLKPAPEALPVGGQ